MRRWRHISSNVKKQDSRKNRSRKRSMLSKIENFQNIEFTYNRNKLDCHDISDIRNTCEPDYMKTNRKKRAKIRKLRNYARDQKYDL